MYRKRRFIHVYCPRLHSRKTSIPRRIQDRYPRKCEKQPQEPGIARFDFLAQMDDPNRFVLMEVYRTPEDAGKHKETTHYAVWRDTVAHMMEESRSSIKFTNIAPDEEGWESFNP